MTHRVLITGGAGFIGTHLTQALVANNIHVRILDIREPSDPYLLKTEFVLGDVRNAFVVESAMTGIDIVVHLAAITSVTESLMSPVNTFEHNIIGTATVANAVRKTAKRLILASSRAVYGEACGKCESCGQVKLTNRQDELLAREDWDCRCPQCGSRVELSATSEINSTQPVSVYGLSKQMQEHICQHLLSNSQPQITILRYFNVYGPMEHLVAGAPRVVSVFLDTILEDREIILYEDGGQMRDFIYIDDAVKATMKSFDAPPGIYNVGSGKAFSLKDLIKTIGNCCGKSPKFQLLQSSLPGDIRMSLADITSAMHTFHWQPQITLEEGIYRCLLSKANLKADS